MAKSNAERSREWRRRQGVQPRQLVGHGTRSAAARHRRAGERPCSSCAEAERAYNRGKAAERRARNIS